MAVARLIKKIETCKWCQNVGIESRNPVLFTELKYLGRLRRYACMNSEWISSQIEIEYMQFSYLHCWNGHMSMNSNRILLKIGTCTNVHMCRINMVGKKCKVNLCSCTGRCKRTSSYYYSSALRSHCATAQTAAPITLQCRMCMYLLKTQCRWYKSQWPWHWHGPRSHKWCFAKMAISLILSKIFQFRLQILKACVWG